MAIDSKLFDQVTSGNFKSEQPTEDMAGNAISDIIRNAASKYDVDPDVMLNLARRESGLNPSAKNPHSTAGGLFQFIDGTWNQYGRGDKYDPSANADAAARMMRDNLDRFGGNYDAALAAHHVGPGKALQALRDSSIGDRDVSTQKWLSDIKGMRQVQDDIRAQRRNGALAEDHPDYNPGFGGDMPQPVGSRSAMQSVGDTGAAVMKGFGNLGVSLGGLYGLATGDVDPNVAQTGGKALADFAESLKSDYIKNKERISQQQIDNADGLFNQLATAAWNNISDPSLFVNTMAEQAANFVPGMGAGRLAKGMIAALGGASAKAYEAASAAEKAIIINRLASAGKVGTGVAVATGAILQGADAGNSAYQQIMERPQAEWDAHPEYQRLATTLGSQGAKQQIALTEARAAFAKSAVLSAGLNSYAPAHSIDKMLVNGIKNRTLSDAERAVAGKLAEQGTLRTAAAGALKGFAGEGISEAVDEGYGQYAANVAEATVNPNKDLNEQVGANAGLGLAFGPMGAVSNSFDAMGRKKAAEEALAAAQAAPAEQPNSPLSRAAAASQPAVAAQAEAEHAHARAADPLAGEVANLGERLQDRDFYDAVRQHENLGPQALGDILASYRVASNYNLDIKQRQAAIERLNEFFQQYDNQPNFTMGSNANSGDAQETGIVPAGQQGVSPARQSAANDVPTYDVGTTPQLGHGNPLLTQQEQQAVSAAEAEYEAAYADLVKAEQLGAGDAELMQKQIAARNAEARLQEIHQAIEGNRQQETASKRDAVLNHVLDVIPPDQNPNRAFDRALKAAGFTDTTFSEAERAKIAQWQQLSDSFRAQQEQAKSAPNQLDASSMGIKSKGEPQAQGQAGAKLREVDAMLNAGMHRSGDKMLDPRTGKAVKLSPAQIARAKHLEKTSERDRVLPAYQAAIEQRTRELQQLANDPNHDEAQAVRLSRAITGLKGIVSSLKKGASLDEAIATTLGNVPDSVKSALKNPRGKDGADPETVAARPADPVRPNRGGGSVLPSAELERAQKYRQELTSMAPDAGWAEVGGRLIRDANDNAAARTKWIPRAEWFVAGMLNSPKASEEAVRKAIAGEPMLKPERLHVMGMMDFLDAQQMGSAEHDALKALDTAISDDSDFGLPDYSIETAAVVELEFAQGSLDVPAFLEAIGANHEENHVTENETGAGQDRRASSGKPEEGRQDGQDTSGAGRTGPQSEGFRLSGQTNEEAAAEHARQQAGEPGDVTKAQADKERDAVPFSMQMQSQPKPQGMQVGLFTADGRPTVAAKQDSPKDGAPTAEEKAAVKTFLKPGMAVTQGGWLGLVRDKSKPHPRDGHQFDNPENGWYMAMHDTDGTPRRGNVKDMTTRNFFVRDGQLYESGWNDASKPLKLDIYDSFDAALAALNKKPASFDEEAREAERQALYAKVRAEAKADPRRTEELSKALPAFDAETERLRKAAKSGEKSIEALQAELKKAKFGERMELNDKLIELVTADIKKAIDNGDMPVYPTGQGTFVAVHPSAQKDSMIQVTRYSERGVFGDSQYNNVNDAVRDNALWFKKRASKQDAAKMLDEALAAEAEYQKRKENNGDDGKTQSLKKTASWVIKNKETGEVLFETFDKAKVDALNTDKYVAVPILEHLQSLNSSKDDNSPERLVERAEAVAKKYDDAGYPDHGKIIRASLTNRQPTRDNVEFWESSFDRNLAQWKTIEKANGQGNEPVEPKLRTRDDLIETKNEDRAYDMVPDAVTNAVLDKLNGYIKQLADKGLHLDEIDTRFPNDVQVIKRNESGLRGLFNRYAKQLNSIARGYKRANEDGFADTEADLADWLGIDVKKLREKADVTPANEGDIKQGAENKGPEVNGDAKLTPEQAKKQMGWRNLGQTNGTKTQALFFYETADDYSARRNGMNYGSIESFEAGRWSFDGEAFHDVTAAKKAVMAAAMQRLVKDGYVAGNVTANAEKSAKPEANSQASNLSKNTEKTNTSPEPVQENAKTEQDFNKYVLISADDISKLRKIDVERVLEQGAVKEFRQAFADWIKAKRPDLATEVDNVMADIAPANEPAPKPSQNSEMDDLKAQLGQAFDEVASILGIKKNLTPEEESQLLPVMAKIFRIVAKMGYVKFKDIARNVMDMWRQHDPEVAKRITIDNLQAGYINIAKEIGGNKRDALDIDSIEDLYAVDADMQERIEEAEKKTNHDATPGQKEAGNYAKGKFPWNGLTISVETAKGEDRTDKETNGDKWRVTMPSTYGYILGTKGADGDHVDVFMGDKPDSGSVYVINQTKPDVSTFDEHKVMLGYSSEADAKADYLASFSNGFGKKVFGSIEGPFSVAELRQMLDDKEFEHKEPLDMGRRLDDSKPLSEINVTVEAIEAETGRSVEMDEPADEALKDVDDRMNLARSLLECLAS